MRLPIGPAAVLALVAASVVSSRGAEPEPPRPYAVVRPDQNPLVKPGGRVPVPTIEWERLEVRSDHPRLIITKETRDEIIRRFRGHPAQAELLDEVRKGEPLACAFYYQLTGAKSHSRPAIRALLKGKTDWETPYIFDWTYDAMTEDERREAIERVWLTVAMDRASGWPRCSAYTGYPDDPRPSETPPDRWPRFYNWTFHDQDWARRYLRTFVSLVAVAGHKPRAAEGVRHYWEYSLKDASMFLDHLGDGSYYQGFYWSVTNRIAAFVRLFEVLNTACGLDRLDPKKHPYLANVGRWILYGADPVRNRVIYNFGDGEMVSFGERVATALLTSNNLARDPHVEWLTAQLDPPGGGWLLDILCRDPAVHPRAPTDLPGARAFPGTGLVVMRSGWRSNDVWAAVRWCDWFDMHVHSDVGSFILYCKHPVAPDTGFYCRGAFHEQGYYKRAVAHNTITVRDPAARVPLNDGDQRGRDRRTWSFAIGSEAWLYHQEHFDRADLLAFETHELYDYCAGDGTRAYRPENLKEFVRQVVFLREGVFIVFDRVETPRPDFEKRWIMHLPTEPRIDGKLLRAQVKGHIEDYDGGLAVAECKDNVIVRCHSLLPAERVVRRIGGALPDIPISALVRMPRTTVRMATGSRWEWTDPLVFDYNDSLTGQKRGALCIERNTPTDAEYEITDTEFRLKLDAFERGRVDEVRLDLTKMETILELARALGSHVGGRFQWHTTVQYLPGYEYYNEGTNYAPSYLAGHWKDAQDRAPELFGKPNDAGAWRIEVYPAKPATRDCFLHVVRVQASHKHDPGGATLLRETPERAEASVTVGGLTYVLTFAKTGPVGGHMRIMDAGGKVLVDRDFATTIATQD